MTIDAVPVGRLLRDWRQRRHLSQLDLACDAEISTRHLSFIETGRASPSRDMVLRLAERLEVPLRSRNTLLTAAGFAPMFAERPLADPALDSARIAIDHLLAAHEPFPALAVDRHWTLIASNDAARRLMGTVDLSRFGPAVNVLRLSLHPDGLASRIVNFNQWRSHILARLRRQVDASADPVLEALGTELAAYPIPSHAATAADEPHYGDVIIPLRLDTEFGVLSFLSTTTIFGTPVDVTLAEIALETFFPADPETAHSLRTIAQS